MVDDEELLELVELEVRELLAPRSSTRTPRSSRLGLKALEADPEPDDPSPS